MGKIKISILALFFLFFQFTLVNAQSKREIDSAQRLLLGKIHDTARLKTLQIISINYLMMQDFDSSTKYVNKGLHLSKKLNDSLYLHVYYAYSGIINWSLSKYKEALDAYYTGMKYCRTDDQLSTYYNNISAVLIDQRDYPNALKYMIKSYEIDKKNGDIQGVAVSKFNIGLVYSSLKDSKNALKWYYESIELCQQVGDMETLGKCYGYIGELHDDLKNEQKALEFFMKGLAISQKVDDKSSIAVVSKNLGIYYLHKGNTDSASKYSDWALKLFNNLGDVASQASVINDFGFLNAAKGNYKKAETLFNESIEINKAVGKIDELAVSYKGLSQVQFKMKNYKEASKFYAIYNKLQDSVLKEKNGVLFSEIKNEFELKEKDKEFSLKRAAAQKINDAEKSKQKLIILFAIVILALVVIFSFFLYKRFRLSQEQNKIIEEQKHLVEEKQTEILDSIHYAKRIQTSIISNKSFIDSNLPENFILFNPKDIVSGDFYWATKRNDLFYLAICDSTGHGVPGAFMSLLNMGFLSEAINEKNIIKPNEIFNYVRKRLTNTISKEGQKDGFDGILICYDTKTGKITYAAANNEPILIRENTVTELPKDKMPVGVGERKEEFKLYSIDHLPGDSVYFYTDGYADQFGGPKGKKFKYKQLNDLLLSLNELAMVSRKEKLEGSFKEWIGDLEQVDDVCIIGLKF